MSLKLPPLVANSAKQQPKQHQPKRNKNSFHEKEKQYWIEVENLRLVKKLYKIDGSRNNYPYANLDSKTSSYMLKMEKEKKKIFEENQRMFERLSRKTSSHYSKSEQMNQYSQHKKWVSMLSNNYASQKDKEEQQRANGRTMIKLPLKPIKTE